jgi:hypothetical protein
VSTPPLLSIMAGVRARPRLPKNSETPVSNRNVEAKIQHSIMEWIRTVAPELLTFHCPNGGFRTKSEAARMKWVGVLAGIPDIIVMGRDGRCWTIEVKTERGVLSPEQRAIRDRLIAMRIPYVVAKSIDDVRLAFKHWGIATRETAP